MKLANSSNEKIFLQQKVNSSHEKLKPESRRDMRALAFHFIYAVDRFNYTVPLSEIVQNFKEGFNLEIDDDALAITIAQGTIDTRKETDALIKPLLRNWRLERLGCCTRLILQLAIWEFQQSDSIPSIVINEAIELAKCFAEKDAYKFINGILDEASKKLLPLKISEESDDFTKKNEKEKNEATNKTQLTEKNNHK